MIKMTTSTNNDHLKIIEGESKIDRTRRLTRLRAAKHRASKRLSDPDFLTKQSKARQAARLIKKVIKPVICPALFEKIKTQEEKVKKLDPTNTKPTDKTINANIAKVKNIYTQFTKKTDFSCDDFSWVRNTDKLKTFFENNPNWKTDSSRNSNMSALASVLRNLDGYEKEYKVFSELSSLIAKTTISQQIGENKIKQTQIGKYMDWPDISSMTKNALESNDTPIKEKAILSLYTLIPPRRLEYSYMKIIRKKSTKVSTDYIKKLDKSFNYLLISKKGKPQEFIMNKYKTQSKYGQQIIKIDSEQLINILSKYITEYKILNNEYLFLNSKNKNYENTFSIFLTSILKKYTRKPLTVNILRHSFITEFLSKKQSLNKRKAIAMLMGNSVETQAEYEYMA